MYEEFYRDNNQKSPFRNTDDSQLLYLLSTLTGQTLHVETADDKQEQHPRATQILYSDFYVGLLSGASTLEEAVHLKHDVSALL